MLNIIPKLKGNLVIGLAALLVIASVPFQTFADDPAPCVPPAETQAGVHRPVGAESVAYTYNCTTGMWESAHYVYNPATGAVTPKDPVVYTYNTSTGKYDTTTWVFSASTNSYISTPRSVAVPPAGAVVVGGPAPAASPTAAGSNVNGGSNGNGSNNQTNTSATNNQTYDNQTNVILTNTLTGAAITGNAGASYNSGNGTAQTGDASSSATILNYLQSNTNIDPSNMSVFTADINGDVNGDLLLNPATLAAMQPAAGTTNTTVDNNLAINNSTDASINNNIHVGAQSGDATASYNSGDGTATSGNATAIANVVNTVNSYITAGKSFVGTININGNLNGDILLPPNFIDTLLASNVPHYTVNTSTLTNNTSVTNTNNASINNNVLASAGSGDATASFNSGNGNATSGNATTAINPLDSSTPTGNGVNLEVFNLTGQDVVASNDLLVFVNNLGKWYGLIFNAPAGATAASLGGNVTNNTTVNNNASLTNTNNASINNNITAVAQSGNADASYNSGNGTATSGNAKAAVSIGNLINDKLTLNGWFGLLFINVFGTWNGSFGVNTSAGNPISAPARSGNGATGPMFQFSPTTSSNKGTTKHFTTSSNTDTSGDTTAQGAVLAAHQAFNNVSKTVAADTASPKLQQAAHHNYILPIASIAIALFILLANERDRFSRRTPANKA